MSLYRSQFHNEYTDIIQEVNRHARNEFIQQFVDIPPVPMIRMQVLFLFLFDAGFSIEQIKQFLVPTLMVQIGLDCHQQVALEHPQTEKDIRTQQLTVLAGDFFSSKYYHLLAKIEDIELIRCLAESIYKVNEWKTELFYNMHLDEENKIGLQQKIDSGLFVGLVFKKNRPDRADHRVAWARVMEKMSLVERLMDELFSYKWGKIIKDYLQGLHDRFEISEAIRYLENYIVSLLEQVREASSHFITDAVKEEIELLIGDCLDRINFQVNANKV